VPERITHHTSFKLCVFFHLRVFLYFIASFLLVFPVPYVLSIESPPIEEMSSQPAGESVYFIPDQPGSPFKFGVAITPDQYTQYTDNHLNSSSLHQFENEYTRTQHADVSTVVRIALDEFKICSGLNRWVHGVEKAMHGYSRKMMLTGELNLNSYKTDSVDYIEKVNFVAEIYKAEMPSLFRRDKVKSILSQFEINKITWSMGFHLNSPEIAFKLGIGEAIVIQSFAGEDVKVGIMIKLSI